jgi:hypothetical protein
MGRSPCRRQAAQHVPQRSGVAYQIIYTMGEKTNGSGATENNTNSESPSGQSTDEKTKQDSSPKAPFVLSPFKSFDPAGLPPRKFLYGKHYQRRTVGGTVAPGGTGKSSLVMVESVSMAICLDLLEDKRPLEQRLRIWYHNGEDNTDELNRRLAGICQHYEIPLKDLEGYFFMTSGNEVPLRVAQSYSQVQVQTVTGSSNALLNRLATTRSTLPTSTRWSRCTPFQRTIPARWTG